MKQETAYITIQFIHLKNCLQHQQINSCINPFLYAIILPAFRQLVSAKFGNFKNALCFKKKKETNVQDFEGTSKKFLASSSM